MGKFGKLSLEGKKSCLIQKVQMENFCDDKVGATYKAEILHAIFSY